MPIQWGTPITRIRDGSGIFHKIDYYALDGVQAVKTCEYTNDYSWRLMETAETYFLAQILGESHIFEGSTNPENALIYTNDLNEIVEGSWQKTNTIFYFQPIDFINLCLRGIPYSKSPYYDIMNNGNTNWKKNSFIYNYPNDEKQYSQLDNQSYRIFTDIGVPNKSSIYYLDDIINYLGVSASLIQDEDLLPGDIIVCTESNDGTSFAIVAADGEKVYYTKYGEINNPIQMRIVADLIQETKSHVCYHFGEPNTYRVPKDSLLITPNRLIKDFFILGENSQPIKFILGKSVVLSNSLGNCRYSFVANYNKAAQNAIENNRTLQNQLQFSVPQGIQYNTYLNFTSKIKLPAGNYHMEGNPPEVQIRVIKEKDNSVISDGPSFQLFSPTQVIFQIYYTSITDNKYISFNNIFSNGESIPWAVPFTSLGLVTVPSEKSVYLKNKHLRVFFHNIPLEKGTVKLKLYSASKRADHSKVWRHPLNIDEIFDIDKPPREKILGYAQIEDHQRAFSKKTYPKYPKIGNANTPNTRAYIIEDDNRGVLQTEWKLSETDLYRGYFDIDYAKWVIPLLKPVPIVTKDMDGHLMTVNQAKTWIAEQGFKQSLTSTTFDALIKELEGVKDSDGKEFYKRYNVSSGLIWDWKPRVPQLVGARSNWDWAHPVQVIQKNTNTVQWLDDTWIPVKIENLNFYFALEVNGIDIGYSINTISLGGAYNDNGVNNDGDTMFEYTIEYGENDETRVYDYSKLAQRRIYMRIY